MRQRRMSPQMLQKGMRHMYSLVAPSLQIDLRYANRKEGSLVIVVAPVMRFKDIGFNADVSLEVIPGMLLLLRWRTLVNACSHGNSRPV